MTKMFEALASGETLELRMYGPIGAGMFGDGVSAESVSRALDSNPHCKNILVRISSPGGNAYDGMAIRSMLAAHPAEKVCEVEGLAASAGSIIAMGCRKIRMHTGSAMMVHEASAIVSKPCSADDLRKMLAGIETLNDGLASVYSERTGKAKKKCREMMAAETWLTPEQAKKDGFCDEIVAGASKMAASFDLSPYGYRNVPAEFANAQPEPLLSPDEVNAIREIIAAATSDDDESDAESSEDDSDEDAEADEQSDDSDDAADDETPVSPHVAVEQTAEASHVDRKRSNSMTIHLIAQAIGLQADADETAVFAAVSRIQSLVAELRSVTGVQDSDGILGAVRGLSEAAKQVPTLSAKIEEQVKALEAQERAAIFAADKADPKGRKLTPALEAWCSTQPLEAVKAFMAAAPHVVQVQSGNTPASQQQPATTTAAGTSSPEPVRFNGKAWEDMSPLEKHNLHVEDRQMYAALQQSFVERGSPRAQAKQQRASA